MLTGIRVLDLSRVIAGPYCAALMGDLGADVIKLERPGRGDDLRNLRGSGQMSASFAAMNRNKRGIAVDLQRPEGVRLAFELARRADVLVENFLPGVTERLGLGYAAVRAANPAIVYASITGFGQTGPLARKAGYNTIAQGMSGLMALTGHARASADARGGIRVGRGGLLHGVRHDQCRARPPLPHRRRAAGGREPARLVARPLARPGGDVLRHRRAPEARGQPEPQRDAGGGVSGPGWPHQHRAAECGSVEALLRRARRRGDGDGPEIRHQ